MNDIGEIIKVAREKMHWTQEQMAEKMGISLRQYNKYEAGFLPKYKTSVAEQIDQILGTNIKELKYEQHVPHETEKLEMAEDNAPYHKTRLNIKNGEGKDVPVFVGNTRLGTIEVYSDDPEFQRPVGHLPAQIFPGCNHAEKVSGDSMHPIIINQGFVVGKIIDKKGIIYGEKYIIHTKYGLSMVKYLQEASKKTHVKLVSYNKNVVPQEIPYDDITLVCRIFFIVNPS